MEKKDIKTSVGVLVLCLILLFTAEIVGHRVMTSFGRVKVSNVWIENDNNLMVRGKLFVPEGASSVMSCPE
jgi:hypothetical protein